MKWPLERRPWFLITTQSLLKHVQENYRLLSMNWIHLLFSVALAAASFIYLWQYQSWDLIWTQALVCLIDVYVIVCLSAALTRTKRSKIATRLIPGRVFDLITLSFIVLGVVLSFAKLYLKEETVCRRNAVQLECLETDAGVTESEWCLDSTRIGVVNFSLRTLTMFGSPEYVATSDGSQRLVLFERMNGVLLVLFAFAIVRSRVVI